jgi:hypothetical protein
MPERRFSAASLLAASLIAALLVFTGTVVFLARGLPGDAVESRRFTATDLDFVMGSGRPDGNHAVIDGFTDGYALLSSGPVKLDAENFRFLRITLNRLPKDEAPAFFWRRSEASADLVQLRLHESGDLLIDLSGQTDWRGEISELGLLFHDDGGEPLVFGPATLRPDSLALRLRLTWDGWTYFEDWSQKSINFLNGGTFDQPVSLPLLVIGWIVSTMVLASLLARRSRRMVFRRLLAGGAAVFLFAWMVLDVRWTANSIMQFSQTTDTYWGVDESERLARGLDGEIYRYIERLKKEVLPERPTRILILGDDRAADFFLQRAKYHLLPHSAYVGRQLAKDLATQRIEFIVFFGKSTGLTKVPGWSPQWQKALNLLDGSAFGEVFVVTRPK